jgi:cold shock CspA family protein
MRGDREAFRLDFRKAKEMIQRHLHHRARRVRPRDVVTRIIRDREFGSIKGDNGLYLYFHAYDLHGCTLEQLNEGVRVEFDRIDRTEGPAARKVILLQ